MTELKRLNSKKLLSFIQERRDQETSDVFGAVYDGLKERIDRGDFDYDPQPLNAETGRFESPR